MSVAQDFMSPHAPAPPAMDLNTVLANRQSYERYPAGEVESSPQSQLPLPGPTAMMEIPVTSCMDNGRIYRYVEVVQNCGRESDAEGTFQP